jgi:predicted permease
MVTLRLPVPVRTLLRTPLVTVVAIVSLALGIGANAAIFSLFDQMLLRPLPVPHPDQLVNLSAPGPKPGSQSCGWAGDCEAVFSYPMLRDLQRAQTVFTGIAAHRPFGVNLAFKGQTLNGRGVLVSGSYFPVLELKPALGRLFSTGDDSTPGEPRAVVLSYDYWRTRFSLDPGILNEALVVNGQPLTIVGVAPRGFEGTTLGARPQVFVPMTLRDAMESYDKGSLEKRRSYWAYAFGRLKPGTTVERAMAALNVSYHAVINDVEAPLQEGMSAQTMKRFRARTVEGEIDARGQSNLHKEARTPLALLFCVTGLVLLIACANIANLLLARAAGRTGEMAIRLSIGAGRVRLVRQLLAEAGLLAAFGGLLGLLVSRWTIDLILTILPESAKRGMEFGIDGRTLLFGAVLTLGTSLLFGLFPALHSTRPNLVSALKGQSGQPSGARAAALFRKALVTAQVCLSTLLLVCAGLFIRSLVNVSRVELGMRTDHVAMFQVSPKLNGYSAAQSLDLFARMERQLAALPGVSGVTAGLVPLLSGSNYGSDVQVEGFESGPDTDTNARFNTVGPAYFRTLGVPLLAGREFTEGDAAGAPKVAIVNEQFAKKFHLGRNAVGKHLQLGPPTEPQIEIVGVVANAKYSEVRDAAPPQFFLPYRQGSEMTLGFLTFYVRTTMPTDQVLAAIPKVVTRIDPNLPVESLSTLELTARENVFMDRLLSVLSTAFAVLATLLAAIGLYGVLAYTVAQRTREIGLRMALGAAPARVRRMILSQMAVMTAVGGVIGLGLALVVGHAAESLLFELKGYDPAVLAVSTALLALIAFAAALVPSLRASRVEPMIALRYE